MVATTQYWGTGRRKTAVARVRVSQGDGKILINGRPIDSYFPVDNVRSHATRPLVALESQGKYDIRVNVQGGGPSGQAGAVSHGIARALLKVDPTFRPVLKSNGLLTRDGRAKERKKYGQPGARKRFQYSKR